MKQQHTTFKTILFRIGGIVLSLFLANLIIYLIEPNSGWWNEFTFDSWTLTLSFIGTGLFIYAVIFFVIHYVYRIIDRFETVRNHLHVYFWTTNFLVVLVMILLIFLEDAFYEFFFTHYFTCTADFEASFRRYFVINLLVAAFINSYYINILLFDRWKEEENLAKKLLIEAHQLREHALQTELQFLKLQLDPHFLFNNFSILTQLIQTDTERAHTFLENLSKVYRYFLSTSKQSVIPLEEELKLVDAYYHLLKIRHQDAIHLRISLPQATLQTSIPPITLQLLIENAIKHNKYTKDQPLTIEIGVEDDSYITVKNNLQRNNIPYDSTKLGLTNVRERYLIIAQQSPEFVETSTEFIVKLPILKR